MKKMKGFRKMLALILALMMVFSAAAALAEEDNKISIYTGPDTPALKLETGELVNVNITSGIDHIVISDDKDQKSEEITIGMYKTDASNTPGIQVTSNTDKVNLVVQDKEGAMISSTGSDAIKIEKNGGEINLYKNQGEYQYPVNVTGAQDGIKIESNSGTINFTEDNVTGTNGDGIHIGGTADGEKNTGTIILNTGNITGGDDGIEINKNFGSVQISAGDVTAVSDGVVTDVYDGGKSDITVEDVKVVGTGSVTGVSVNQENGAGAGTTTVNADSVSATSIGDGKDACGIHAGRYSEIIVDGDVTAKGKGSAWGVRFLDSDYRTDTDESSITVKGNITATGGSDPASTIGAQLSTLTANVTLDATNGKIVSDGCGVFASTAYGQVTANVNKVEGNGSEGIYACVRNSAYTSPLDASEKPAVTVTATDTVTGNTAGIMIKYYTMTDGKTTIAARSDVTATGDAGKGLYVHGEGNVVSNVMTDVLVEGTLSGNTAVCIDHEKAAENTELTVWRAKSTGEGNALVVGENGVSDKVVSDFTAAINYILRTEVPDIVASVANFFSYNKDGLAFEETKKTIGKDAAGKDIEKGYYLANAGDAARLKVDTTYTDEAGDQYDVKVVRVTYTKTDTGVVETESDAEKDDNGYFFTNTVQSGGGWWLRVLLSKIAKQEPESEEKPEDKTEDQSEGNPEPESEVKPEENPEDKPKDQPEENSKSGSEVKPEDNPEDKPEENPEPESDSILNPNPSFPDVDKTGYYYSYNDEIRNISSALSQQAFGPLLSVTEINGKARLDFQTDGQFMLVIGERMIKGKTIEENGRVILETEDGDRIPAEKDGDGYKLLFTVGTETYVFLLSAWDMKQLSEAVKK